MGYKHGNAHIRSEVESRSEGPPWRVFLHYLGSLRACLPSNSKYLRNTLT